MIIPDDNSENFQGNSTIFFNLIFVKFFWGVNVYYIDYRERQVTNRVELAGSIKDGLYLLPRFKGNYECCRIREGGGSPVFTWHMRASFPIPLGGKMLLAAFVKPAGETTFLLSSSVSSIVDLTF